MLPSKRAETTEMPFLVDMTSAISFFTSSVGTEDKNKLLTDALVACRALNIIY